MNRNKVVGVTLALLVVALTSIIVFNKPVSLLVMDTTIQCTGSVKAKVSAVQYVYEDRIFDEYGSEVIWRGAGGSYLFHTDDYMTAWQVHLREIEAMGLNTMRLVFKFPWDNVSTADVLDYARLDWVINFLAQNNIKAILDNHGGMGFGGQMLIDSWKALAQRYRGDSRVAAYELFNEPGPTSWDPSVTSRVDAARAYMELTQAIREVDPDHICVWQSPTYYIAWFEDVLQYLQPNVVYTMHRWWTRNKQAFDIWTPEQISYMTLEANIRWRNKFKIPFWLGEFGTQYPADPEYNLTKQLLWRCEEQAIGWNLWCGKTNLDKPWTWWLPFFPLKGHNTDSVRKLWDNPVSSLKERIIDFQGMDHPSAGTHYWKNPDYPIYTVELWHDNDSVTLKPEMVVRLIINHMLADGTFETVSDEHVAVSEELTIRNEEGTAEHPGDWNITIYSMC